MRLVIAEKPSVAKSIASVIGANQSRNGYYEGNNYIVSWCLGHVAGFENVKSEWTLESLPVTLSKKIVPNKDTKEQFDVLKSLMFRNDVESLIEATDAGREGEAIFRYAYKAAGCNKPFQRLWISSMTDDAVREGFRNLRPSRDYDNLYNAAVARDFADKVIGFNGTVLFSVLYEQYKPPLSIGRVQTPTLNMICERENEIKNFVKEAYFKVHLKKEIDGIQIDAVTDNISNEGMADNIVYKCNRRDAEVTSIIIEEKSSSAPKLYDLTTLQRECNRMFGLTSKDTLDTVQSLYEKKLCTYPRSDSNYLTSDMADMIPSLIDKTIQNTPFLQGVTPDYEVKKCVNDNKVTDHHAIIPTDQITEFTWKTLSSKEYNVLSLICLRLITATARKQRYKSTQVEITCNGVIFKTSGKIIIDPGYKQIEDILKTKKDESEESENVGNKPLPDLNEGDILQSVKCEKTKHYTKPPAHFTEDTILLAMEKAGSEDFDDDVERIGLGTTATRAAIIENLINKGYITREKKKLLPTSRAFKLMDIIPDELKSPQITSDMENMLALVARGEADAGEFLSNINYMMNVIIDDYKNSKNEESVKEVFSDMDMALGVCPNCNGPILNSSNGAYCKNRCGMMVGNVFGRKLTENQVRQLLEGNKILLKGLKKKDGSGTYDMYFKPIGIQEFKYTSKNGEELTGKQFVFERSFPQKKKFNKNGKG